MKKILTLISLFFTLLVNANQPHYTSNYEEKIFKNYIASKEAPFLDLLMVINSSEARTKEIKLQLDKIVLSLKNKKIENKSKKKQVKEIYKYVHKKLLRQYEEESYFNEIFDTGKFNCVSATALYAYMFDVFGISYQIKETPEHVYIIADIDNDQMLVESTNPLKGTIEYDQRYVKDYLQYLTKNKIISEKEREENTNNYLFNKYHNKDKNINKHELASLQYSNDAIINGEDDNERAYRQLEKAYLLFKDNKIKYTYNYYLAVSIDQSVNTKKYDSSLLGKFINLNAEDAEIQKTGLDIFKGISQELTITSPNIDQYKKLYNNLKKTINKEISFSKYSETYFACIGYYHYLQQDFDTSFEELNSAYIINNTNLDIQRLINNLYVNKINTTLNADERIQVSETYFEAFPFLFKKDLVQIQLTTDYLQEIFNAFRNKNIEKGEKFIQGFGELVDENPDIKYKTSYIESSFSTAAMAYKPHQYRKIITTLEKGASYAPESVFLKNMLKELKHYKNSSSNYTTIVKKEKSFSTKVKEYFKDCWTVTTIEKIGKEIAENPQKEFNIKLSGYKTVEFESKTKKFNGKWSIRSKNKLLYLVPNKDKENYLTFAILEIEEDFIKIRPFINNKMTNRILTLTRCK